VLIDPTVPLTLAQTLGSVLASIVEAQQQAARATVEFINDVGFGPLGPTPDRKLVTTKFAFTKLDENRQPASFELEVPLLALVDIPLIVVRKATITLSYNVTETTTPTTPTSPPTSGGASNSLFNLAKPAVIKGQLAKRSAATGTDAATREQASIDITVEVEKAAPAVGMDRLLDVLEVGMTERPATGGTD
jgi:hypothetical protein